MEWISKGNVLIVGLGLMGGSYAQALKRLGFHMMAIDKNQESIDYALKNHLIDRGQTEVTEEFIHSADAIIFGLYPTVFKEWIRDYQQYIKEGTMLTDVTGIKSCVVYDIQDMLKPGIEFIAAHPMAGREVYGVQNSDDRIFREANYIVTPTEKNTPEAIDWCKSLGRILGFRKVSVLSPEKHDEMIGFLSQLTHCIAVSLMTCNESEHLADYTGDSFRDLTRIARINENMWSELFVLNKEVLLEQMDKFSDEFIRIRNLLADNDIEGLKDKMRLSTKRRAYFDK